MNHEPESESSSDTPAPFATQDIGLAAFLVVRGHSIAAIDGPSSLVSFVFSSVAPAEVELYRLDEPVPACSLVTTQRRLFALVRHLRNGTAKLAARPLIQTLSVEAPVKPTRLREIAS